MKAQSAVSTHAIHGNKENISNVFNTKLELDLDGSDNYLPTEGPFPQLFPSQRHASRRIPTPSRELDIRDELFNDLEEYRKRLDKAQKLLDSQVADVQDINSFLDNLVCMQDFSGVLKKSIKKTPRKNITYSARPPGRTAAKNDATASKQVNTIEQAAKECFSYDFQLTELQTEVLERLLDGKSLVVNAPPCSGKSLIYQLYSYIKRETVFVVGTGNIYLNQKLENVSPLLSAALIPTGISDENLEQILSQLTHFVNIVFISADKLLPQSGSEISILSRLPSPGLVVLDDAGILSPANYFYKPSLLAGATELYNTINHKAKILALCRYETKEVVTFLAGRFKGEIYQQQPEGYYFPYKLSYNVTRDEDKPRGLIHLFKYPKFHCHDNNVLMVCQSRKQMEDINTLISNYGIKTIVFQANKGDQILTQIKNQSPCVIFALPNQATSSLRKDIVKATIFTYVPASPEEFLRECLPPGTKALPSNNEYDTYVHIIATDEEVMRQRNSFLLDRPSRFRILQLLAKLKDCLRNKRGGGVGAGQSKPGKNVIKQPVRLISVSQGTEMQEEETVELVLKLNELTMELDLKREVIYSIFHEMEELFPKLKIQIGLPIVLQLKGSNIEGQSINGQLDSIGLPMELNEFKKQNGLFRINVQEFSTKKGIHITEGVRILKELGGQAKLNVEVVEEAILLTLLDEKIFECACQELAPELMMRITRNEENKLLKFDFMMAVSRVISSPTVDFILSKVKGESMKSFSQRGPLQTAQTNLAGKERNLLEILQRYIGTMDCSEFKGIIAELCGLELLETLPFNKITTHRDRTTIMGDYGALLKEKEAKLFQLGGLLPPELKGNNNPLYKGECAKILVKIAQGYSTQNKSVTEGQASRCWDKYSKYFSEDLLQIAGEALEQFWKTKK